MKHGAEKLSSFKKEEHRLAEKADESAYARGHDGGKATCHFFGGFANVTGATGAAWDGMAILFRKNGKRICPLSAVFFAEGKH